MDERAHCLVGLMHRHRLSPRNLPTADHVYQHLSQLFPIYRSLNRPRTWKTVSDLMHHHYLLPFPSLVITLEFPSQSISELLEALGSENAFGIEGLPEGEENDKAIVAVGYLCARYRYRHDPDFSIHAHLSALLGMIQGRARFGSAWAQLMTIANAVLQVFVHQWLTSIACSHFGVVSAEKKEGDFQQIQDDVDDDFFGNDSSEEVYEGEMEGAFDERGLR